MIIRYFSGVLIVVLSMISMTSARSVQSPHLFQNESIALPSDCQVEDGSIACLGDYKQEAKVLSGKLTKLWILVQTLDKSGRTFQADQIRATIKQALPLLWSMHVLSSERKMQFKTKYVHAVLSDIDAYYMSKNNAITAGVAMSGGDEHELHSLIRKNIIQQLLARNYTNFVSRPFPYDDTVIDTAEGDRQNYTLRSFVQSSDQLDQIIRTALDTGSHEVVVHDYEYDSRNPIYLFKDQSDLEALSYSVVSHRERTNQDAYYRRFNIAESFGHIGRVVVLNPGQSLSFLKDSLFDPKEEQRYMDGKVIFQDEEVDGYGGGLCGGSTALYQGTVLNKGLSLTSRNHTKRYSSLYNATINGEHINTPGLDSTIYSPSLDLIITNVASYPIVIVSTFDAEYGSQEKVFTLGKIEERGSAEYVSSYPRTYSIEQQGGEKRDTTGRCYNWNINGRRQTRCYKEVF